VEGRLEHAVLEVEDELGLQHTQVLPLHLEPRPASHPLSEAEGTRPASHHQLEEVEGDTHYATKGSTSLSSNLKPLKPAQDDKEAPTIREESAESTAAVSSSPPSTPVLRGAEPPDANGKCTRPRRPYHVVMTAASGKYQEWQSRVAYYHYLKQKREHPCSDMGGFTRLFNTPGAQAHTSRLYLRSIHSSLYLIFPALATFSCSLSSIFFFPIPLIAQRLSSPLLTRPLTRHFSLVSLLSSRLFTYWTLLSVCSLLSYPPIPVPKDFALHMYSLKLPLPSIVTIRSFITHRIFSARWLDGRDPNAFSTPT
ncbi:MAG: hypothetical protein SGPRY_003602, partial [Prymnesium sp.]